MQNCGEITFKTEVRCFVQHCLFIESQSFKYRNKNAIVTLKNTA